MGTKRKVRILLADDHNLVREGFKTMLEPIPDMEVIQEVSDGRSAVTECRRLRPDVVVMDISMPDLNGIDATGQIVGDLFNSKVLCLSLHKERAMVQAMLKAGASGYLLKSCTIEELVTAIRTVASGDIYLSPQIARDAVACGLTPDEQRSHSNVYSVLTNREREVLQLIAEGMHTKAIADRLHISPKTVLAHREHIMQRTGIDSVAGLTRYALRQGLCEL